MQARKVWEHISTRARQLCGHLSTRARQARKHWGTQSTQVRQAHDLAKSFPLWISLSPNLDYNCLANYYKLLQTCLQNISNHDDLTRQLKFFYCAVLSSPINWITLARKHLAFSSPVLSISAQMFLVDMVLLLQLNMIKNLLVTCPNQSLVRHY